MSEKEKKYMPQSTAGLIRYMDVEESRIKLTPTQVIALSITFAALVFILKFIA